MPTNPRGYEIHPGTVNYRNTPRIAHAIRRSMVNDIAGSIGKSDGDLGADYGRKTAEEVAGRVENDPYVEQAIYDSIAGSTGGRPDQAQQYLNDYRRRRDTGANVSDEADNIVNTIGIYRERPKY